MNKVLPSLCTNIISVVKLQRWWVLKSKFGTFWQTVIHCIYKIQWSPWSTLAISNFSCMFLNPITFSNLNSNCSKQLDLRNLKEQVKKDSVTRNCSELSLFEWIVLVISKILQILGLQHRIFFSITRTILVRKYHFLLNSQMNFKSLFISDFSCWILQLQWVPETRPKNLWSSWKNYVKMVLDFVFCFSLDYYGIYGGN